MTTTLSAAEREAEREDVLHAQMRIAEIQLASSLARLCAAQVEKGQEPQQLDDLAALLARIEP